MHTELRINALPALLQAERLKVDQTITGVCLDKKNLCVRYNVPSKNIRQQFSLFKEGQQRHGMTFDPVPDGAPIPSEAEAETALRSLQTAQKIPQAEAEFGVRLAFAFADFVMKNWSESNFLTTEQILSEALAQARQTHNPSQRKRKLGGQWEVAGILDQEVQGFSLDAITYIVVLGQKDNEGNTVERLATRRRYHEVMRLPGGPSAILSFEQWMSFFWRERSVGAGVYLLFPLQPVLQVMGAPSLSEKGIKAVHRITSWSGRYEAILLSTGQMQIQEVDGWQDNGMVNLAPDDPRKKRKRLSTPVCVPGVPSMSEPSGEGLLLSIRGSMGLGDLTARQTCLVELVDAQQNTYKYADFPEGGISGLGPFGLGLFELEDDPFAASPCAALAVVDAKQELLWSSDPSRAAEIAAGMLRLWRPVEVGERGEPLGMGDERDGKGLATAQLEDVGEEEMGEEEDAGEESPSSPMAPVFPPVMVNSEGTSDEDDDDVRGTMKVKNQKWQMKNTKRLAKGPQAGLSQSATEGWEGLGATLHAATLGPGRLGASGAEYMSTVRQQSENEGEGLVAEGVSDILGGQVKASTGGGGSDSVGLDPASVVAGSLEGSGT